MKKKLVVLLALIMAFTFVFAACGGGGEEPPAGEGTEAEGDGFAESPEVSLILTNHDPENSLAGKYVHEWADLVFEKSKGRIEVVVNNGGSLAKPTESLDKVKSGAVDLAWGLQSFYAGQFPMTDGLSLPMLPYTSATQASETMMDIWLNTDLLQSDPGYAGTKVIMIRSNCDAPIITASKKLNSVADLSGMTIRATAAPLVSFLGEFKATGAGCPINELFQNMQNGAFDGALTDWHAIENYRLYDNCADYYADEAIQYNTYYFLMNEAKYNSLSDENKAVIDECSGLAALDIMKGDWDTMKETTEKSITEAGGEVYKLSDADHQKLLDAADKVQKAWIAAQGDKGQQLYDTIIEASK